MTDVTTDETPEPRLSPADARSRSWTRPLPDDSRTGRGGQRGSASAVGVAFDGARSSRG